MVKLRIEAGLKQTQIAEEMEISAARYSQYESGKRTPDYDLIIRIADFYNVSLDYIFGRSEYRSSFNGMPNECILLDGKDAVIYRMYIELSAISKNFVRDYISHEYKSEKRVQREKVKD